MSLSGQRVIVTGASRGIGKAIALHLASLGARVAISYRTQEAQAQEVISQMKGDGHFSFPLDLADAGSVGASLEGALERLGGIEGLVNNAGITGDQLALRMSAEEFAKVIHTNLTGTFLSTKAVLKRMIKARKGSLVHMSSVIGQTGNAGQCSYAASKAGIIALSKSLAHELASRNVRSNCVAPGFIATEMTDALTEAQKDNILGKIPLGRVGTPEEVAFAVEFLLSERSQYVTGQTLSVNGGLFFH